MAHKVQKWTLNRPKQVYKLALLGLTNKEMAEQMEISYLTFANWARTKPMFKKWLNRGRCEADGKVARALYKRAIGFTHDDIHISNHKGEITITPIKKYYPPDVQAAIKWLTVRQKERWTEVAKTESRNTQEHILKLDLKGYTMEELLIMKKVGLKQLMSGGLRQRLDGQGGVVEAEIVEELPKPTKAEFSKKFFDSKKKTKREPIEVEDE